MNPAVSTALEAVILKAIDKDPSLRYQGARELLVDLERLAAGHTAVDGSRATVAPGGGRMRPARRIAVVALVAIVAATWFLAPRDPRVGVTRSLARVAQEVGGLEVSDADVYYTEATYPGARLRAITRTGGMPRDIPLPWGTTSRVLLLGIRQQPTALLLLRGGELFELQLPAGAVSRLDGPSGVVTARWSPAADALAWVEAREASDEIWVGDGRGGGRTRLVEAPRSGDGPSDLFLYGWHPSGRFLRYHVGGRLFDVPREGGAPREVLSVDQLPAGLLESLSSQPVWSTRGDFFIVASNSGLLGLREWPLWWIPRGSIRALSGPTHLSQIRFTPDGRQLIGCVSRLRTTVVRLDPDTRAVTPVLGGAPAGAATFSPDAKRVAWLTNDGGRGQLMVGRPDGTDAIAVGSELGLAAMPPQWSPDGRSVAYTGLDYKLRLAMPSKGTVELLAPGDDQVIQADACWSPDGRSVLYGVIVPPGAPPADDRVYLRRIDLSTGTITRLTGSEGLWSPKCTPDGRILAFDVFAQRAHDERRLPGEHARVFLKLWDPRRETWTALAVEVPEGAGLDYPTWSRDGRYVYAYLSQPRRVVRFQLETPRLETVFDVQGLGETSPWLALDPGDAPLVHRDESMVEIVEMDWEEG